jgi:subtilisin family serine protease
MSDRRSRLRVLGLTLILAMGAASALPSGAQGSQPEGPVPAAAESKHTIHLKSRTFTPKPGLERAAIVGNRAAKERVHFIAQFSPLPTSADRRTFARAGVQLQASLGDGAYVASSTPGAIGHLKAMPGFRWAGPLEADDKIDPAIRNGHAPAQATTKSGDVALTIQVHPDVSMADAAAIAQRHGGTVIARVPLIPSVTAIFSPGAAASLAAEDAVLYVAAVDAPLQEHNDGARAALNATPLFAAPYNLNGAGTTILVYDSGLASHSDYNGRITQTDTDAGITTRLHSTHVAGTALGSGANSNGNDSAGTANNGTANQWAGIATAANLATYASQGNNQSTDVLYDDAGGMNANFTTAITGGVDLATMSLGNNTGANGFPCGQLGDYTNTSILIDQIVAGSINGQELIWFESAGNERNQACAPANGFATISSPAPAKNSIVVGAINSNDNSMTNFSSWGPTDDGRLRPDLTGPGCQSNGDNNIWSTAFRDPNNNGTFDAGEATNSYTGMCGTSMSTPAVAGVGALLVQQWRATYGGGTRPLPHSMKALLAHTATDLGNPGPDYRFGYGQVNAQAAADLVRAGNLIQVNEVDQGQTDTWYFTSNGATAPRITLAWSDPAAARNSTTQLVNNLDLVVTRPGGGTHRPQVLTPGTPNANSAEGTDNLNVMEMVLGTAEAGTWKVEVAGTAVPQGPSDYTLITPNRATENVPPTADAGGPYNTNEGQSVVLDGTGSSDPEGAALTYEWDLDNNGSYETTGATPTFPAKGQDGPYTVVLRVTDSEGSQATDTAVVNVANVAPTVVINAITGISEFGTTTVSGTITDPGWLDPITATIDFDDGAGPVALSGTLENDEPVATFTFSVNKQYGDNGTFVVTVTGYDDDTSANDTENAVVANLNPTATINSSGEQVYDGVSAFVLQKGQSLNIPASSTDPGSDDLTFRWIWGDGSPDSTQASLVNSPALDPPKSPSVQPRNVSLSAAHAYLNACLFTLGVSVTDDDTGTASDSAVVLVTGNATVSRGHGWWLNQYRAKSGNDFTAAELQCYLNIVNYLSMVFSEATTANTRASATNVLNAPAKAPERVIFDQHALGAWLNFANGSVKLNTLVDTNANGIPDAAFGSVMFTAETIRLNPASTTAQVKAQKDIIARIITQSG